MTKARFINIAAFHDVIDSLAYSIVRTQRYYIFQDARSSQQFFDNVVREKCLKIHNTFHDLRG